MVFNLTDVTQKIQALERLYRRAEELSSQNIEKFRLAEYYYNYGVKQARQDAESRHFTPPAETKIKDSFPADAASKLAGALMGMTFNAEQTWAEWGKEDPDSTTPAEQRYLQKITRKTLRYLLRPEVAFYRALQPAFLDFVIGEGIIFAEETPFRGKPLLRFQSIPASSVTLLNDEYGFPNTAFRVIRMTRHQIKEKWPKAAYPESWNGQIQNETKVLSVVHAVVPRNGYEEEISRKKAVKDKAYGSVYYVKDEPNLILEESGYDEFPYIVFQFQRRTNSIRGEGPGLFALPLVEELSRASSDTSGARQLTSVPPMLEEEGAFGDLLNLRALARNSMRPGISDVPIRPLFPSGSIDSRPGQEQILYLHEQIGRIFYLDRLSIPEKRAEMREAEVFARQEENLRELAPVLSNLHYLAFEVFNRVLKFLKRYENKNNQLQPPGDLKEGISFTSPLARAQRIAEVQSMRSWLIQFVQPLAQFDQEGRVLLKLNLDDIFQDTAKAFNIRTENLRSDEEVQGIIEQRQQQELQAQQTQAQAQLLSAQSQGVRDVAAAEADLRRTGGL